MLTQDCVELASSYVVHMTQVLCCFNTMFFRVQLKNRQLITEDLAFTSQEEKTLRYVSGFIVFSLANRHKDQNNQSAKIILQLQESWGEKSDRGIVCESIYDYTKAWTEKINRGGLFCVNTEFYLFIE